MAEDPLKNFEPNKLIPDEMKTDFEEKGEIFTTQSNIEAPTEVEAIQVKVDEDKQKQLLKYVDDCNQLQGYYVEKHEELKMVFALLLNLFQIYKYSVNLMGNMKTEVTAAATERKVCFIEERIVHLQPSEIDKASEKITLFKNLNKGHKYKLEITKEDGIFNNQ